MIVINIKETQIIVDSWCVDWWLEGLFDVGFH